MTRHLERVHLAEELGFAAVWLCDVPFNVPSFGDAGQVYDPFVYPGFLAARTRRIALGVASIILPPRHPAHERRGARVRKYFRRPWRRLDDLSPQYSPPGAIIADRRARVLAAGRPDQLVMQPLYFDLANDVLPNFAE